MKIEQLPEILELHSHWLRTSGLEGRRAALNGADLRLIDLSGVDLTSALLAGTNLERADLHGARLTNADLQDAKLSYANLDKASLSGANLSRVEGRGMSCFETHFLKATLREALLDHCTFYASDFSGVDASHAVICGSEFFATNLRDTKFVGAVMRQTNFSNCATENADFTDVDWRGEKDTVKDPAATVLSSFGQARGRLRAVEKLLFAAAGLGLLMVLATGAIAVWLATNGKDATLFSSFNYGQAFLLIGAGFLLGTLAALARMHIIQKAYEFRQKQASILMRNAP